MAVDKTHDACLADTSSAAGTGDLDIMMLSNRQQRHAGLQFDFLITGLESHLDTVSKRISDRRIHADVSSGSG
jgi:hypothetical protein